MEKIITIWGYEIYLVSLLAFMVVMIGMTSFVKYVLKKKIEKFPKFLSLFISWIMGAIIFSIFALCGQVLNWDIALQFLFAVALANGGFYFLKKYLENIKGLWNTVRGKK